ncbi:hypothetical protein PTKU64_16470 [Paraburkholderia terrae]|uniref:Uncharacterized protein n=1 Tax=Paraburkholderia terrae TaxID=311230 RepID=A0ABM7TSS8_9BURK|nr:hypothetical protein PTKU64_16470 [Paraburkholderia terrae]
MRRRASRRCVSAAVWAWRSRSSVRKRSFHKEAAARAGVANGDWQRGVVRYFGAVGCIERAERIGYWKVKHEAAGVS